MLQLCEKPQHLLNTKFCKNVIIEDANLFETMAWCNAKGFDVFQEPTYVLSTPEDMALYFKKEGWKYFDGIDTLIICDQVIEVEYVSQFLEFIQKHSGTFLYCGPNDLSSVIEDTLNLL